ncbi:MAG: thioredoxin family protein, partial [Pseudomonadota bacterium]
MLLNTPICDFGAPAPDFSLATPHGVTHSKDGLMGENGLLVAFICNHCPYVIAIIERLVADIKTLQDTGFGVACIMSNNWADYPADSPDNMIRFAATHGLTAPYLIDADQSVGQAYSAVCTPDFFGYNAQGGLQYRGRLDDAAMGDPTGRVPELLNAMRQVAETGKGP